MHGLPLRGGTMEVDRCFDYKERIRYELNGNYEVKGNCEHWGCQFWRIALIFVWAFKLWSGVKSL